MTRVVLRPKKSKHRSWITLNALCLSGLVLPPTSTWQTREQQKQHRGIGQAFHLSPWPTEWSRRPSWWFINILSLMTSTKQDERKQKLRAHSCRAVGWALWLIAGWEVGQGAGGGRQRSAWNPSKTQVPCDHQLLRVSVLNTSKNAPTTRTRKLWRLWLCI
jgi:hypothetical protein